MKTLAAHWVSDPKLFQTHRVVRLTLPSESGVGPFGPWAVCGGGAVEVPDEQFSKHIKNELQKMPG